MSCASVNRQTLRIEVENVLHLFISNLYQNLYLSSYDEVIIIHLFLEKSSRGITRNFTNSGTVVNSCYIF